MSYEERTAVLCDDWHFIGTNTGGFIYRCDKCGAIKDEDGTISFGMATAIDGTIYCPEQTRLP